MQDSHCVRGQQILGALVEQGFTVRLHDPAHSVYEISREMRCGGRLLRWSKQLQAVELLRQLGTPRETARCYYAESVVKFRQKLQQENEND